MGPYPPTAGGVAGLNRPEGDRLMRRAVLYPLVLALALATAVAGLGAAASDLSFSCSSGSGGDAAAVAVRPLAGGRTTDLPAGVIAAAVGRVILAPRAELPVHTKAGPGLLSGEAGNLGLEIDDGPAWVRDGGTGASREVVAGTLGAGDGALLRLGTAATRRNAVETTTTILVVMIVPAEGAGAPS